MAINFSSPYALIPQTPSTGTLGLTPQVTPPPTPPPTTPPPQQQQGMDRNQRLAYILSALGGALKGQDPLENIEQMQKMYQMREAKRLEEERLKKLDDAIDKSNLPQSQKDLLKSLDMETKARAFMETLTPTEKGTLERFTLYDKNTGTPVRTILKSEAEDIDRDKFIVGPLADPFADTKNDIETWAVTDKMGNRVTDLVNPTAEDLDTITKRGLFLNKTPALTTAGRAKDIGEIKGWNDKDGLQKRAISYNTLVNTGQRIINNLYENQESVLATGDIAQVFDQLGEELKAMGVLVNQEEKTKFVNETDPKIRSAVTELAQQTAITESQLLDFAYQIAKVRGQEGRGLSDQDFRNFQKIISAGRTAEQKAAALYDFISGVGTEVESEIATTRDLKNLILGRNPDDKEANAIITGINDLYTVGFGQINNPFMQQMPTASTMSIDDRLRKYD